MATISSLRRCRRCPDERARWRSQRDAHPAAARASGLFWLLPDRGRQRRPQLAQSLRDVRAGHEATKFVAKWITDENFGKAIPNAPKITSGKVVAHGGRMVALV